MIKEAIGKVITGIDLTQPEMVDVMNEIMSGAATEAQIGSFITALRMKGETIDEITGAAIVMRRKAEKIDAMPPSGILVDTCGTGGDGTGTFNVSTAAAFVVAGAGVSVAKHGNRSVSSHCGSADVLEALGVDLSLTPDKISQCIREVGIGFMFAPLMHGAMKYAIGPRREIGVRTIFNILGPLTNPAGANVQVMGVFDPGLTEKLATVLGKLGSKRALVVCGAGNMDEITVTGETTIADWDGEKVSTYQVKPEDFGLSRAKIEDIKGGENAQAAASQLKEILGGKQGACLDMVLVNAGAALMAAGKSEDLKDGVELARDIVRSGKAMAALDAMVAFCRK
ncbi:MAG: anthranilate phosphoribosyltransferase [Proteobacteria bacterium]|nr:anthranilate phosphoribosyltransferase [Pseudomonadota bacterium]MBU1710602.1 anthranilate phosphoribosyltransferase [Pseudomonadota bacterium]